MDKIRIFDCSNSEERPAHRGGGGPRVNDVMRALRENAPMHDAVFVDSPGQADVIVTNDVFPRSVRGLGKPLVKRMCGPFCQRSLLDRNASLNESAGIADKVVFISQYSADQQAHMYGAPRASTIVRNRANPNVYRDIRIRKTDLDHLVLAATATNWNREEKRYEDVIRFARMFPEVTILLIGTCRPGRVPDNVVTLGYIHETMMAEMLNRADGFLNLSHRDAAPKVVAQGVNCGLPVLYADSGGTREMCGDSMYGIPIPDDQSIGVADGVPSLDEDTMARAFDTYLNHFDLLKARLDGYDREEAFVNMINGYFEALRGAHEQL